MVIFAGFLTYHEGTHTYTLKTHLMGIYTLQDQTTASFKTSVPITGGSIFIPARGPDVDYGPNIANS
jgi:hypothetical protein